MWQFWEKSGQFLEKSGPFWEKVDHVGKSGPCWEKVGHVAKKWAMLRKSGPCCEKVGHAAKKKPFLKKKVDKKIFRAAAAEPAAAEAAANKNTNKLHLGKDNRFQESIPGVTCSRAAAVIIIAQTIWKITLISWSVRHWASLWSSKYSSRAGYCYCLK